MSVDLTLRIPVDLVLSIRAAAEAAGVSVETYVVRAARRQVTLEAAQRLAVLGLGGDLAGEGDVLPGGSGAGLEGAGDGVGDV